nr:sugar phosphate isomerase/epimerase [Cytophagales bacterium]
GIDPVEGIKKLEGRIISLHFKDLNAWGTRNAHDVPWGTGTCNVAGVLHELNRQGFKGVFSAEYEHNWENNLPEVAESMEYFKRVASQF